MPDQAALSPSTLGILAERLGPLPLINHFLALMGLLELLEQHVPTTDGRSTVSHAQALALPSIDAIEAELSDRIGSAEQTDDPGVASTQA